MKKLLSLLVGLLPVAAMGQLQIDHSKYPDFKEGTNPDPTLMIYGGGKMRTAEPLSARPDHVNNMLLKFFPPVFNQDGGSCGSASRICYMFTHEINAFRNLDGSTMNNNYPSHFVWLLTYGNSGKDEFVQFVGVPNSATYGGRTYSSVFGNQDTEDNNFGWMNGYDKWYSGMWNRMQKPTNFTEHLGSKAGREALKNYLWNHNGDPDFHGGGIVGVGVASGGNWKSIPKTPANDEAGVTGQYFVNHWGSQVDHALTIVGYDDRVEFDLNGNGIYGEESADEKGAWIIVNSWGDGWCNSGAVYCPYAYAGPTSRYDEATDTWSFPGNWWTPEVYSVRKNYRPLRTIKLTMDYSRRSELCLGAGVSADLNSDIPEKSIEFDHFKYAGDGNYGNTNPAPEIPMLGMWADGKLHDEPMEFGYDLTDLTASYNKSQPLKYFFIVKTKSWAEGKGHIRGASIINYEENPAGIEMPFDLGKEGMVEIKNAGETTIISVVVPGLQYYPPRNAAFTGSTLKWDAPLSSPNKLEGYKIIREGNQVALLPATTTTLETSDIGSGTYSIYARYQNDIESAPVSASTSINLPETNEIALFNQSGFSIPGIFDSKYEEATIEFYIRPNSVKNYNQSAGPGWGSFMFHANSDGSFTAGWNTSTNDRCSTAGNMLAANRWTHVAIVVKGNNISTYINGRRRATTTSSRYSGIGGFGALEFTAKEYNNSSTDAALDEIRIWNYARSADELLNNYKVEFAGQLLPEGLIAYYKGDIFTNANGAYLRDRINSNHAKILNENYKAETSSTPKFTLPEDELAVKINAPEGVVYAGLPVTLTASRSLSATSLVWNIEGASESTVSSASPSVIFKSTGDKKVTVTAASADGTTITDETVIKVESAPAPDATFTPTATKVAMGENVSFIVNKPVDGYTYHWDMEGADTPEALSVNAAAVYSQFGNFKVTLTVTSVDGKKSSSSCNIEVTEVAPEADFTVSPAVVVKGDDVLIRDASKYSPDKWQWEIRSDANSYISNNRNAAFAPDMPGVYNVMLSASNNAGTSKKTVERALIVTNADSKNGLNFSQSGASVTSTKSPLEKGMNTFTIEWWMNPGKLTSNCLGIGDKESTFLIKCVGRGALAVYLNNNNVIRTNDGVVVTGQWHHFAVSVSRGTIKVFRDGVMLATQKVTTGATLPEIEKFSIGVTGLDMTGSIDEFRVWGSNLAGTTNDIETKLKVFANQPIDNVSQAEADHKLLLYYQFNQNGGNVTDATSNANTGIRTGFGPDGDAWGLSKGVFCLNFETIETEDLTAEKFTNYKQPFSYDSAKPVNSPSTKRWYAIKDWTLENCVEINDVITGTHVDLQKNKSFTVTSGWDGFSFLSDHKAYQTFELPAGDYTFSAVYDSQFEGQPFDSYLVAAEGKGLPDTGNLDSALGSSAMAAKGTAPDNTNSVKFILTQPATVSLGMVVNMSGSRLMAISEFKLTRAELKNVTTGIDEIGDDSSLPTIHGAEGIYDMLGRKLGKVTGPGLYIIDGKKVYVK